ncbi:putative GNAT family N-acyltransferase [Luteimicrobium subarcticum]|uniref:Putative GNAT family N-acyltransferase n=1 Tax=Luteimicrobium subarcticum TaxID=620910 RepID=A0A2M8WTZ0_9MICO|nr:putative GNAT family N-acyltransferase [Luteimicrobium subarcticum]
MRPAVPADGSRVPVSPRGHTAERVVDRAGLEEAWALRTRVFVVEQQVPLEEEIDALDTAATTTHVLVRDASGAVVATGRLLTDPAHVGEVHVGRVAVDGTTRGTGVGALLMRALEDLALAEHAGPDGTVRSELSAQVQAIGFYERVGYVVDGPVYLDAGIEHRDATKVLGAS